MLAESHYRKYVAKNVSDFRGWLLLINALTVRNNFVEARYTIDRFVGLHEESDIGRYFAIRAYFNIGDHVEAYRLCCTLSDEALQNGIRRSPVIRFLLRLHGLAPIDMNTIGSLSPLHKKISDFNSIEYPVPADGVDVVLLLIRGWHYSIQKKIGDDLRRRNVRCLFLKSIWEVIAARPRILVVSDALVADYTIVRQFLPDCRIVYTRHGLGDKNYACQAAGQADATCLSSAAVAEDFSASSMIAPERLWVTGYPQMDTLFQNPRTGFSALRGRCVLVAPTFTEHLHAGEMLGKDLVHKIRGEDETIRIMIRPHPHSHWTHGDLVDAWVAQARALPNVTIHMGEEVDLLSLFDRCGGCLGVTVLLAGRI